uniref:Uncharacterized protein n=1 Tax=Lygus hesperus TaxID=30085 RepID=A0A0A9W241_LYGHE
MNRLGSIKWFYVSCFFCFSFCTRHMTEGVDVTASTDFNSPPNNDSVLYPQIADINVTNPVLEPSTVPRNQSKHSCCQGKITNETSSISRNHSGESTLEEYLLPRTPHELDESNRLQLETTKFIAAEKLVPREEGTVITNEVAKDNSNNSKIISDRVQSNHSQQNVKPSKITSNFTKPFQELNYRTVGGDDDGELTVSISSTHPPTGFSNQPEINEPHSISSNKDDIQKYDGNSTHPKVLSPPHKPEIDSDQSQFTTPNNQIPGEDPSIIIPIRDEPLKEINGGMAGDDRKEGASWTKIAVVERYFQVPGNGFLSGENIEIAVQRIRFFQSNEK